MLDEPPVTARKCEKASEQPHTSRTGRMGLDAGPIGCGAPGVGCVVGRAGVIAPGVAICRRVRQRERLVLPFPLGELYSLQCHNQIELTSGLNMFLIDACPGVVVFAVLAFFARGPASACEA